MSDAGIPWGEMVGRVSVVLEYPQRVHIRMAGRGERAAVDGGAGGSVQVYDGEVGGFGGLVREDVGEESVDGFGGEGVFVLGHERFDIECIV